jgi:hypothetical protein
MLAPSLLRPCPLANDFMTTENSISIVGRVVREHVAGTGA